MKRRLIIQIEAENGRYKGVIRFNNRRREVNEVNIGPMDRVMIRHKPYPLEDILTSLIEYKRSDLDALFDERGQLAIGRYLYDQVFCSGDSDLLAAEGHERWDIRILSGDEYIGRLPWALLADPGGNYLTGAKCAISIASHEQWADIELPACPKILMAAPEPASFPETLAEHHQHKLADMLTEADHRYYPGNHFRIVHTWEDFQDAAVQFRPDIVYYYGHGDGGADRTRLVFSSGVSRTEKMVPVKDMENFFRNHLEKIPAIVYLNCCYGDSGGIFGAGRRLGSLPVAAVITNRTVAHIDAAQAQAEHFWRSVILDGLPPHQAVCDFRDDICGVGLTFADARWMTPVMHCHYNSWKSRPPQKVARDITDPHWSLKLDRVNQYSKISYLTRLMLKERKPKILAYLWYGMEGQGVDLFHHRLQVELQEELTTVCFKEINPNWPMQKIDLNRSFDEIILEAFDFDPNCDDLNHIPGRIRSFAQGRTNKQVLIYIRHQPLRHTKIMGLNELKTYFEWLETYLAPLPGKNAFIICGISYIVGKPAAFAKAARKTIDPLVFKHTAIHLLDELEIIGKRDLLEFIKTHNIRLPERRIDSILDAVLKKTGGRYDATLDELKAVVNRPYDYHTDDADDDPDDTGGFGVDDE